MINRNVTRSIKNTTETTLETQSVNSDSLSFVLTTPDFFYLGFQGKFSTRHFNFSTLNTNSSVLTVEQWDGSAWVSVKDLVDQTLGFTRNGFVSWVNNDKWISLEQTPVSDLKLFWVRVSVSADLSAGTSLQSVLNLFSDDDMLRAYYPEIISDTRFLPPGRTDFLEQYEAAKNLVVLRLKQRRLIDAESQIIDINNVAVAAVHAAAWLILSPIALDEDTVSMARRAQSAFENELNELAKGVDVNNDGKVSDAEQKSFGTGSVVRR